MKKLLFPAFVMFVFIISAQGQDTIFLDGFESTTGDTVGCMPGEVCGISDIPENWTQLLGVAANPEDKWFTATTSELSDNPEVASWPLIPNSGERFAMIWAGSEMNDNLDAWLISPDIALTANKTYKISFYVEMPGDEMFDEYDMLEVFIGQGKTITAMTGGTLIKSITDEYIKFFTLVTVTFTPDETGTYNLGFHAINEYQGYYGTGFYILLDDISVSETESVNVQLSETTETINIYPNPVPDVLYIKTAEPVKQIEVLSVNGKLLKTIIGAVNELSVRDLRSGVYMLRITTGKGVVIKRIIKK
jgi:hypothetical protein